jgi:hypothetical protein
MKREPFVRVFRASQNKKNRRMTTTTTMQTTRTTRTTTIASRNLRSVSIARASCSPTAVYRSNTNSNDNNTNNNNNSGSGMVTSMMTLRSLSSSFSSSSSSSRNRCATAATFFCSSSATKTDSSVVGDGRRRRQRKRRSVSAKASSPENEQRMPWEQKELEKMKNVRYSQPRPATAKKIESDEEYEKLKTELKTLTLKYGAGLSLYCLLGYGIASSLSSLVGVVGSYLYLQFLSEYVDTVNEERDGYKEEDYTRNLVYEPVTDVKKLVFGPESVLGKIATIYSRALFQKRLIVPVAVVASESLWNHFPGHPFDFNYGVTLIGFLTYKASALTVTYGTLKPLLQEDAKNAGNWEPEDDDE